MDKHLLSPVQKSSLQNSDDDYEDDEPTTFQMNKVSVD